MVFLTYIKIICLAIGVICAEGMAWSPTRENEFYHLPEPTTQANFKTQFFLYFSFLFSFECRYIYSVEYGRVVDTKSGHDDASKY